MIKRFFIKRPKTHYHVDQRPSTSDNMTNNTSVYINPDIVKLYAMTIEEFNTKIMQNKQKTQKAMRITLMLKLLLTLSSIFSIAQWLKSHHHGNVWALILVISEVAGVLLDTLPYFQQRIELPKTKLKLEHIYFDMIRDFTKFQRFEIDEREAQRRYWTHRRAWVNATSK